MWVMKTALRVLADAGQTILKTTPRRSWSKLAGPSCASRWSLESAQRLVESLVPTLENLYPMTRVYGRCIGHVESQNPLKKQRSTLLEQKEARPALYKDSTLSQLRGSV